MYHMRLGEHDVFLQCEQSLERLLKADNHNFIVMSDRGRLWTFLKLRIMKAVSASPVCFQLQKEHIHPPTDLDNEKVAYEYTCTVIKRSYLFIG